MHQMGYCNKNGYKKLQRFFSVSEKGVGLKQYNNTQHVFTLYSDISPTCFWPHQLKIQIITSLNFFSTLKIRKKSIHTKIKKLRHSYKVGVTILSI